MWLSYKFEIIYLNGQLYSKKITIFYNTSYNDYVNNNAYDIYKKKLWCNKKKLIIRIKKKILKKNIFFKTLGT